MEDKEFPTFPTLSDAESYGRAQVSETSDLYIYNPTSDALSDAIVPALKFEAWKVRDLADMPSPLDPSVCGVEVADGYVTLRWKSAYDISLDEIQNPEDLLWEIHHISKKFWRHMTPAKISAFIMIVALEKGWVPYGKYAPRNEMPKAWAGAAAEREKMTPAIRYQVLRRDNNRCRCCGNSVSTGAILHVDHITPVSRGGKTTLSNLQTLCSCCNLGKRDLP